MGNQPPKMHMNLNLDNCPEILCTCGGKTFTQIFSVRILPSVMSPTGKTGTVNIAHAFACTECGNFMDINQTIKTYEENQGKVITLPRKEP